MSGKDNSAHLLDERRPFIKLRIIAATTATVVVATTSASTAAGIVVVTDFSATVIFLSSHRLRRVAILIALISIGVRRTVSSDVRICSAIVIVVLVVAAGH